MSQSAPEVQQVVATPEQQGGGLQIEVGDVVNEYDKIVADLTRKLAIANATITHVARTAEASRQQSVETIRGLLTQVEALRSAAEGLGADVSDVQIPEPQQQPAEVTAIQPRQAPQPRARKATSKRR